MNETIQRILIANSITPEPPAPSCTISLAAPGTVGTAAGASSLDVDGQTLSKTLSATSSDRYGAGTPDGESITINWSGRRALEFGDNDAVDFGIVERGIYDSAVSKWVRWEWRPAGNEWAVDVPGGTQKTISGAATDVVALVVDGSTGDAELWRNGALEYTDTSTFSSSEDIVVNKVANQGASSLPSGASTTTTLRTAGSDMAYSYNGANDWCGNAI